jgi:hypothetical protein
MPRRVYIAARYADREAAAAVAGRVRRLGHISVSTWHDRPAMDEAALTEDQLTAIGRGCMREVRAAGALVLLGHPDARGAIYEAAAAYHLGHDVHVVGDPRALTLMLRQPGVRWHADVDAALAALEER